MIQRSKELKIFCGNALRLLKDMRRTGKFSEAITVRCKINAYVYEQPTVDEY